MLDAVDGTIRAIVVDSACSDRMEWFAVDRIVHLGLDHLPRSPRDAGPLIRQVPYCSARFSIITEPAVITKLPLTMVRKELAV